MSAAALKTTHSVEKTGETVFLNVSIVNPDLSPREIPANLSLTLRQPIVDNPSEYNLIISRFSIPGRAIPLFFFQTLDFPNTDVNKGIYSVVIGYQGNFTAPVYLEYIPETLLPPIIPTFNAQNPRQDPQDTYYYNYSYVGLANMVTTALRTAILNAAGFLPVGVDAYMIFNNQSGFYSLLGTQNMYNSHDPTNANNIQIYFNTPLSTFFAGFKSIHKSYNAVNGQDELVLIENNLNNAPGTQDGFNPNMPAGYYQIQLEFNSDSSLETMSRIFITSNSLGGVVAQSEVTNSNEPGSYQNIITDFVPAVPQNAGDYRSKFQYFAQSEFYRRTLTQKTPLNEINTSFFWQGIRPNVFRQLILEPGDTLSIQFIFEKR